MEKESMNMNTFTSSRKANITVSNYFDVTPDIINGSNLSWPSEAKKVSKARAEIII
jgi:hypothetical protein